MTVAAAAAGILVLGAALAAEQIELKPPAAPKLTKAERIAAVTRSIAQAEARLTSCTDAEIAKSEQRGHTRKAEQKRKQRADDEAALKNLRPELAWLKGELTLAGAESQVKGLAAALEKAADGEKPAIQAALDAASQALALVKKLEESEDF
jgi:hypothetical protein